MVHSPPLIGLPGVMPARGTIDSLIYGLPGGAQLDGSPRMVAHVPDCHSSAAVLKPLSRSDGSFAMCCHGTPVMVAMITSPGSRIVVFGSFGSRSEKIGFG